MLNGGVGVEHVMSDDVSVYGAFHTDFSASRGKRPGERGRVGLGHLPRERRRLLPDQRQPLHPGRVLGDGREAARAGLRRSRPEAVPDAELASEVDIRYSKLTFLLGFVFGR